MKNPKCPTINKMFHACCTCLTLCTGQRGGVGQSTVYQLTVAHLQYQTVIYSTVQYYTLIYRKEGECFCDVTSGPLGKGELERTNTGDTGEINFQPGKLALYTILQIKYTTALQHILRCTFCAACVVLYIWCCKLYAAYVELHVSCVLNILFCIMCVSGNVLHILGSAL